MALYPCPECKREISTDATACPHCGKKRYKQIPKALQIGLGVALCFMSLAMCVSNQADKHAEEKAAKASAATAAQSKPSGPPKVQPGDWFGFRDQELLARASKLAAQGDKAAWAQLMSQGAASGAIVKLAAGEEVSIEETGIMSGSVKIRRKGELKSWWTNFEAVK